MKIAVPTAHALREIARDEAIPLVVNGQCMEPVLRDGDRVSVRSARLYKPGDIVAFRREDGRLLIHRVLGYTADRRGVSLLAKGDRLSREDEPVGLASVVGRVVGGGCRPDAIRVPMRVRIRSLRVLARTLLRRSVSWASATAS